MMLTVGLLLTVHRSVELGHSAAVRNGQRQNAEARQKLSITLVSELLGRVSKKCQKCHEWISPFCAKNINQEPV